jgi:P4 family phage/plasmid primase-like protien
LPNNKNASGQGWREGEQTMTTFYQINDFPKVLPNPDNIPEFLKAQPWAVWKAEPKPDGFNKAPLNPVGGYKVGTSHPEKFGTFEQAVQALATGKFSGFGPLLTGNGLVGFDIDHYKETFEKMPQVAAWLTTARNAGAYCEKSPSGNGLRLYVAGALPAGGRKSGPLEIYADVRFLTATGKRDKKSGMELIDGQELIDSYLALLPPEKQQHRVSNLGSAQAVPGQVEELCKCMAARHPDLWNGNWKGEHNADGPFPNKPDFANNQIKTLDAIQFVNYPSQSEADFAMCGHITREAIRMVIDEDALADTTMSVFERSGLYREEKRSAVENHAIPKIVTDALAAKAEAAKQAALVTQTDTGAELATHEPGDILAGRTYARAMRNKLLWIGAAKKYLNWDGARWGWCNCGEEMSAAKKVAGKILDHASTLFKADSQNVRNKKLMSFATSLQNLKRLEAMVTLAKSEDGMAVGSMLELDSNKMLLGVRNGVVNLKDGGLLAPDPAMLITRQVAAEYHSDAVCPKWLEFLDQIFMGDRETIDFIRRALGYTLTGETTEEALFICFGFGANGKSVFGNVVSTILGDYAQAAPPSLITARRADDSGPRNDIARLCGARLTSINETQNGDRLDEQVVKMLAGREQISARFLHGEFFDFWPTAKPWLRTNHKPIITGEDDGIWRRLHLIPFRRKFAEHERNPWLEEQLLEERDGILAWMVRGCLEWKRIGLKPSDTVRRESATYRKESDLLGEFLDEMTTATADTKIEQIELFNAYRLWHEANGTRYGSKTSFTKKLAERGYPAAKSNGKKYYAGLTKITSSG